MVSRATHENMLFKEFIKGKDTISYVDLENGLDVLQHQSPKFKIKWKVIPTIKQYDIIATTVIGPSKIDHLVGILSNDVGAVRNCIIIYDKPLNKRQIQLIHMFAKQNSYDRENVIGG